MSQLINCLLSARDVETRISGASDFVSLAELVSSSSVRDCISENGVESI